MALSLLTGRRYRYISGLLASGCFIAALLFSTNVHAQQATQSVMTVQVEITSAIAFEIDRMTFFVNLDLP